MSPRTLLMGFLALLSVVALGSASAAAATIPAPDVPPPVATPSGYVCPSGPNSSGLRLWIHVTKWCIVPGVRKQVQLKVQMKIHNQSHEHNLDISQDQVRVVLHELDSDRWSPSSIGEATRDRPLQTIYEGESVWAVPASADGAYDVLPHKGGEPTFATHWPITELGPGQTLEPHVHYGDLVFNIPVMAEAPGKHVIDNVVGIAYVKGREIIALCDPDAWGPHRPANSF